MNGQTITHHRECVEMHSLPKFRKMLVEKYNTDEIAYDDDNEGVWIDGLLHRWSDLAGEVEWFDDAEIVTDANDDERVMVWLNVD